MRHIHGPLARLSTRGARLLVGVAAALLLILAPAPLAAGASSAGTTSASSPVALGLIHSMPIWGKAGILNAATSQGKSENVHYFRGPVARTNTNYLIFWEPSTLQDGAPTSVSARYNALIERYFRDVGGTGLYNNNTQYYDTSGPIANNSSLGGVYLDTSPYPASGCQAAPTPDGCVNFAQVEAEVLKVIAVNGWTAEVDHTFYLYLSFGEGSCAASIGCFGTDWCAWHTWTVIDGQNLVFALLPDPGTDLTDCGTGAPSPNNDPAADSVIGGTSHEQMESVTDPVVRGGWYAPPQPNGGEIGDLCVGMYGPMLYDGGQANQAWGPNGKDYYRIQEEWSNASHGCVQSGP